MPSDPPPQPNTSQDLLEVILIRHKTGLEELLNLLYSGEARDKIKKDNIYTFESDLRQVIADLRSRRNENRILIFIDSVDEIVNMVSDAIDSLTLAAGTFEQKGGGLKQRLKYFKECREHLEDVLDKFKPELVLPATNENEDTCSA